MDWFNLLECDNKTCNKKVVRKSLIDIKKNSDKKLKIKIVNNILIYKGDNTIEFLCFDGKS